MTQYLGKSQPPSEEHPLGVAVCGTPIIRDLIVWTNEMWAGQVVEPEQARHGHFDGWFDVVGHPDEDGKRRRALQNFERVATTFEGKSAVDEWWATKPPHRVAATDETLNMIEYAFHVMINEGSDMPPDAEDVFAIVRGWRPELEEIRCPVCHLAVMDEMRCPDVKSECCECAHGDEYEH